MKRLLFALFLFIPTALSAQSTIRGIVIDSLTQKPMPSATVYVNGTTQGTTTDNDGRFELNDVRFPSAIIFSFVGYEPKALDLSYNPGELKIRLKANSELPEVEVSDKVNKKKNKDLEYFKKMFLGDDKWGKHAIIKNEDALIFEKTEETTTSVRRVMNKTFRDVTLYTEIREMEMVDYDTVIIRKSVFNATATEPLVIDLPLLGYELHVDLVKFTVREYKTQINCDMLGYFYYKPYENVNKRKAERFQANRKRAYYGSIQHFLRSFAEDQLAENGFMLTMLEKIQKEKKTIWIDKPVDINKYSLDIGNNMMLIYGLKDRDLTIKYYQKNDGSPTSLLKKYRGIRRYSLSGMNLLEDTCLILKNGIVMDNNIVFNHELSKRRVAACLPDNYYPFQDTTKINVRSSSDYESELIKYVDNIHQFNTLFPQEKVYLEFDNTAYFQGENIWFKAFVTHATSLERAPSGVLYVDFLAPTGQLIKQQKLKIVEGQADGAITLLDAGTFQTREKQGVLAYPSGFYEVRAYTQNMLDFNPEAIFSRVIPVYTQPKYVGEYDKSHVETDLNNPLIEDLRGKNKEKNNNINVSFYPEGGDMVHGLPCRVAFKATGADAFGIEGALRVEGLWDSVNVVHDGMGSFIIKPIGSETAYFRTPDGNTRRFHLPKAKSSGYSMMADMISDSRMDVNIWRTSDLLGEQTALAVTCRGDVIYFEEIKDVENSLLEIDCSKWPVGVCRVTLYNKEGNILSSRSIFHGSVEQNTPKIEVNTDSLSRQSCDKEVLEFRLTDQEGNPFRDRFCLSVRDARDYGSGKTDNLQTNLLLSSDLRGYIHDPAWYFESDDETHRKALDLLTMVQGWERYEWQYMTGLKDFEEKHRIEEGLTMNGWILSYATRKPEADMGVYASLIPDYDKTLFEGFDYQTDSTGYFGFDLSDFYGRAKFIINLMSAKRSGDLQYEKTKRIRLERADRPKPRPYLIQETDLSHNKSITDDYKVDFSDYDLTPAQRKKMGKILGNVDIEEESDRRRFIDYDTFTSFEAEEDTELELDEGGYSTDLYGYFLDKGIRFGDGTDQYAEAIDVNGLPTGEKRIHEEKTMDENGFYTGEKMFYPLLYIHNNEKLLTLKPFDDPWHIDMIDVKSIIVYDEAKHPWELADLIPLMIEWSRHRLGAMPPGLNDATDFFVWLNSGLSRYNLVDVQIKEDKELISYSDIKNLGRRTTTVKGFSRPVQFYSPEYPDGPILGNIDSRRTLYWNANVITDQDGYARVEFYNNNFTHKFTINASGITASGVPYILNSTW